MFNRFRPHRVRHRKDLLRRQMNHLRLIEEYVQNQNIFNNNAKDNFIHVRIINWIKMKARKTIENFNILDQSLDLIRKYGLVIHPIKLKCVRYHHAIKSL